MFNLDFLNSFSDNEVKIYFDYPLKKCTSFKIGGNADAFCEVMTSQALVSLLNACKASCVPYYIIGNGSNLLVSDKGVRGVVIRLGGEFKTVSLADSTTVRCGAGATLASLCSFALENSLGGLEFAWGIPGSVGGAVYMNAGAYDGEIKNAASCVWYINSDLEPAKRSGADLGFSYRKSSFTDSNEIITEVYFSLEPNSKENIRSKMDELLQRRKSKQPLEFPSAGSTFKRPEGGFAAALIEECGLKGKSIGGAQVSTKHSGFVINKGGATCEDVKNLIAYIKEQVYSQKGIMLECEVKMIGEL